MVQIVFVSTWLNECTPLSLNTNNYSCDMTFKVRYEVCAWSYTVIYPGIELEVIHSHFTIPKIEKVACYSCIKRTLILSLLAALLCFSCDGLKCSLCNFRVVSTFVKTFVLKWFQKHVLSFCRVHKHYSWYHRTDIHATNVASLF